MSRYAIRGSGRNARPEKPGDYVGFIGCDQVGLLPVRMAASRRTLHVVCPYCHELHVTSDPMPRLRRPGEIVTLIEDGMPMAVPTPVMDPEGSGLSDDDEGGAPPVD